MESPEADDPVHIRNAYQNNPKVNVRQNGFNHGDRRSMIEFRQTLWEPNSQRQVRGQGSSEHLPTAFKTSPLSASSYSLSTTHPSVYQGSLPGNRHSYGGGPVLLQQFSHSVESEEVKQEPIYSSPQFGHRRVLQSQRSLDSGRNSIQCSIPQRRSTNRNNFGLSSLEEGDSEMSSRSKYDIVDQGPEMADSVSSSSPRGDDNRSTTGGGTPKHSARPPQQMLQPVPGQVFVDPSTGQHFIVPQTGPTPLYYQPMYYPPPPGAPPGATAPGYYPYAPPIQGYAMAPLAQFSSRFAVPQSGYSPRPAYQQAACSTDDLSRGIDESSAHQVPGSPHFSKGVTSFAAGYHSARQQQYSPPTSQPEDPENGRSDAFRRDSTRSSAEFGHSHAQRQGSISSISSQPGHESTSYGRLGGHSMGMNPCLPSTPGSAPILNNCEQQSMWWTRQLRRGVFGGNEESLTDVESQSRSRHSPPTQSTLSDSESTRHHPFHSLPSVPSDCPPPPALPKPKAIRMEIDLTRPMPEEEELKKQEEEERTKAKASRAAPTSFTVSFDGEGDGPKGKGLSLQDAARRGRMARRSAAPVTSRSDPPQSEQKGGRVGPPRRESSDDKGFLLERLLHGDKGRPATAEAVSPCDASMKSQKDSDNQSDAGTYVIGQNEARQHSTLITTQIIERDSDASSDTTETTASRSPSPVARNPYQSTTDSSKMLLSELAKLKDSRRPPAPPSLSPRGSSSSCVIQPKTRQTLMSALPNRSVFGMAASSAGLTGPPRPTTIGGQSVVGERMESRLPPSGRTPTSTMTTNISSTSSSSNSSNFRRADGGRFSMRTAPAVNSATVSPKNLPKQKPPFVGGGRPLSSGNPEKQRETQMNAWLRRKDYNPMRAAVEAKKAAALKARGDQFVSNRSISFHVGPQGQARMPSYTVDLVRNKSSESLVATAEDEARSHASQRVIAEYSRGVVEDINKLTKQHSKTKDQKEMSILARTVDLLSNKCKKSIELIRAQNKGCLSVSVEDLLATAVEPPRDDESLTDQLDRLSNAFDAVQRYLEQYSLDDKEELSSGEEADELSASGGKRGPQSTFSSFSAYRQQPRQPSSGRSVVVSSVNRPARTTAYRAKLLGQHRSPSGGRGPSKNN